MTLMTSALGPKIGGWETPRPTQNYLHTIAAWKDKPTTFILHISNIPLRCQTANRPAWGEQQQQQQRRNCHTLPQG
jgi:hypothetical protein